MCTHTHAHTRARADCCWLVLFDRHCNGSFIFVRLKSALEKRSKRGSKEKRHRKKGGGEGEGEETAEEADLEMTLKEEQARLEQEKEAILKNKELLEEVTLPPHGWAGMGACCACTSLHWCVASHALAISLTCRSGKGCLHRLKTEWSS